VALLAVLRALPFPPRSAVLILLSLGFLMVPVDNVIAMLFTVLQIQGFFCPWYCRHLPSVVLKLVRALVSPTSFVTLNLP
jgi:hypothetical protein